MTEAFGSGQARSMGKFVTLEISPLFSDWALADRSALAHFLEVRSFKAGESIIDRLSNSSELFIVSSGSVKLSAESHSLEVTAGASFGELSLIHPSKRRVSAKAITPVETLVITAHHWLEMKQKTPSVAVKLMESILRKLSKELSSFEIPARSQWIKSSSSSLI